MRVSTCYELSLICISEIEVHTSWTVLGLGSSILGVYLDWVQVYLECTWIGFEYTWSVLGLGSSILEVSTLAVATNCSDCGRFQHIH